MGLVARILTRVSYMGDIRWIRFYAQRRFLSINARTRISNWLAARRQHSAAIQISSVQGKAAAVGEELHSKGIVPLGRLLDDSQCQELYGYFQEHKVRHAYRSDVSPFFPLGEGRTADCHIAHHDVADVVKAPHLLELANHPEILAAAEAFLGCKPTISYMAVWWSYPTNMGPQQAENYHRDVDDWRFLKFFVYLTDVDESTGPHYYVTDSAKSKKLRTIGRFQDDAVEKAFGRQSIRCMTGTAGTAFLENTFGIHKGRPVDIGHRLICQFVYSMFPVPYGPRQPVLEATEASADGALDQFVNRIYLQY